MDFPYPYKGMLAINSDVEWTSWSLQKELIEYFRNIGLDCSFSYWFYARGNRTWSLFEMPGHKSQYFEEAIELMKKGILDANHAFGGRLHSGRIDFNRSDILTDYEQLEKYGVKTPVFSNHGSDQDTQNIGGDWASYHKGDVPGSDSYHLDRTLTHGTRYFWTDIDYLVDKTYLKPSFNNADSLFRTQTCRDGNKIICFRRYLGKLDQGTCAQNIDQQLKSLLTGKTQGYSVIYQHLGVHRTPDGKPHSAADPVFSEDCHDALKSLARFHQDGIILVTTTSKLLNHALMMAVKPWEIIKKKNEIAVYFKSNGKAEGVDVIFRPDDFAGWSVRTSGRCKVSAFYEQERMRLEREVIGNSVYFSIPMVDKLSTNTP